VLVLQILKSFVTFHFHNHILLLFPLKYLALISSALSISCFGVLFVFLIKPSWSYESHKTISSLLNHQFCQRTPLHPSGILPQWV
jgi:hypothetical protein